MPLLSRPTPRQPPRRAKPRAPTQTPVAIVGPCVEVKIEGVIVAALPQGALWIENARALVVSDLHLEKGSSFARNGQMLPPYDTGATLARIAALMDEHEPDIVVSLGDSFHDGGGPARMHASDRALLQNLLGRVDWVWIEGNHDSKSATTLGGVVREMLLLGPLLLRHAPAPHLSPGEIAGHLHPCAKIAGRGRSVRRRCFATDGKRLVMPAFGAYTGGLNLRDEAFDPIFPDGAIALALGRDRVHPAPQSRQLSDF